MTKDEVLLKMMRGGPVMAGSEEHSIMFLLADSAMRITAELNTGYHSQDEITALIEKLTGRKPEGFGMFPPFTTDCGRNIFLGKNVFINSGCRFQDQGGIMIGDGCLIGHNVVMATINHDLNPERRTDMTFAPIVLGKNVWVGSNATILPGVTIGDGAVIAAGAVVNKSVEANTLVGGVPAKVIRKIKA